MNLREMVGTEVQIYPGDSYSKQGIIKGVEEHGVLFKITKSADTSYKVGEVRFIAFSAKLTFAVR